MSTSPILENIEDDWDNDKGIILDSIPLDWIMFISLYLILIGIAILIRWYYYA